MKWKLLLFLSVYTFFAKSQTGMDTDGLNNLNNIYLYALSRYCSSLDSLKTKTVYVEGDNYVSEQWPRKIGAYKIEYLRYPDLVALLKKKKITLVRLGELQSRKGDFYVYVIPLSASYKKRSINLVDGGGLRVDFTYEPEKKGFSFKSEKWNGI